MRASRVRSATRCSPGGRPTCPSGCRARTAPTPPWPGSRRATSRCSCSGSTWRPRRTGWHSSISLGIDLVPAQAARVPLAFQISAQGQAVTLPAGSRVAAPPPPESSEQIVFETERAAGLVTGASATSREPLARAATSTSITARTSWPGCRSIRSSARSSSTRRTCSTSRTRRCCTSTARSSSTSRSSSSSLRANRSRSRGSTGTEQCGAASSACVLAAKGRSRRIPTARAA